MTIKNLYPNIEPTLNLSFALTKALDPRITFSRASSGAVYDGRTVAKAEENLLLRSQEFDNAAWVKEQVSVTANNAIAPDGTTTAETITTTASTTCFVYQTRTTAAEAHVFSFFVKQGTAAFAALTITQASTGTQRRAFVNLSNGTIGTVNAGITNFQVESVGNGWYRCSGVHSLAIAWVGVYLTDADNNLAVTSGSTAFLWGAQLEARSAATAYTPTTTQPITNYIPALQTAAAGVARFDHNPITGESLGLLIEEQRTNLATYSEDFGDAAWTKQNSTVINTNPFGFEVTATADGNSGVQRAALVGSDTTVSIAIDVKNISCPGTFFLSTRITAQGLSGFLAASFDLTAGAVISSPSGGSASILALGGGWYRLFLTYVIGANTYRGFMLCAATASEGQRYLINNAQFEAGAFPTSYIPTTTAQVTRSADAASMTGANFSSWYRADEGTVYAEYVNTQNAATSFIWSIGDGTVNNRIGGLQRVNQAGSFLVAREGATQVDIQSSSGALNVSNKISSAYKVNDFVSYLSGSQTGTSSSGILPLVNRLSIGWDVGTIGALYRNGYIKKLAFYPKRLANAQLQALTQN